MRKKFKSKFNLTLFFIKRLICKNGYFWLKFKRHFDKEKINKSNVNCGDFEQIFDKEIDNWLFSKIKWNLKFPCIFV